jgi:hypothetical protein
VVVSGVPKIELCNEEIINQESIQYTGCSDTPAPPVSNVVANPIYISIPLESSSTAEPSIVAT